jgi:hypothetical protein
LREEGSLDYDRGFVRLQSKQSLIRIYTVNNTLVVLGAWSIWKTRNDVVFNGAASRIDMALLLAREEVDFWMLAGAKDLGAMVATRLPN